MKKLLLFLCGLCILLPLGMLVLYAFAGRWPWPALFPESFSAARLYDTLDGSTLSVLLRSIGSSFLSALLSTLVAAPAARAIACYHFPGKRIIRALLLAPVLLPSTAYFVGLQTLFTRLGIIDTTLAVILSHAIVILPYGVWTLTDVMNSVGLGLEEQARSLGASPFSALATVTLPLLLPALVSVTALGFVISFGQYFLTLMIGGGRVRTFAMLAVPYIQGGDRQISALYSLIFVGISAGIYSLFGGIMARHYKDAAAIGKGAM